MKKNKILFTVIVIACAILFAVCFAWVLSSLEKYIFLNPTPIPATSINDILPTPSSTPISNSAKKNSETVLVTRVIDGDTIELKDGRHVRYIGVNTPETVDKRSVVQCFGKEASIKNSELVLNKQVRLVKDISDKDKYERLLRYVYVDDIFVNDYLVRQGYGRASTYPPDVKYRDQFRLAEQSARENNTGLWESCPVK